MSTVPQFTSLLEQHGSDVLYHRADDISNPCPCRTPEGFRDPMWHLQHPLEPVCNEQGFLQGTIVNVTVKAFVQPIQSTRATRLQSEYLIEMFGEVKADDHLGIFPIQWAGTQLEFHDWSPSGEDYVEYADKRFLVVNANTIPDPSDGNPYHHHEVGLRRITDAPVNP